MKFVFIAFICKKENGNKKDSVHFLNSFRICNMILK